MHLPPRCWVACQLVEHSTAYARARARVGGLVSAQIENGISAAVHLESAAKEEVRRPPRPMCVAGYVHPLTSVYAGGTADGGWRSSRRR